MTMHNTRNKKFNVELHRHITVCCKSKKTSVNCLQLVVNSPAGQQALRLSGLAGGLAVLLNHVL